MYWQIKVAAIAKQFHFMVRYSLIYLCIGIFLTIVLFEEDKALIGTYSWTIALFINYLKTLKALFCLQLTSIYPRSRTRRPFDSKF